jgi:hypothetical protein
MSLSALGTREGRILISYQGRQVAALAGQDARRVIERLAQAGSEEAEQMVLAKATGNVKWGNER